ncbi:MAG: nucleotidyl transferase AbiEii/AbiGii toxin family protein [Chloroflexi bacterium]|nr:nucleotidyl transferase AbiEii/AbiGii toxin family protein [Chloroflexota bacterium]
MGNAARDAGVVARRIHLVVAIDRLLVRLLAAAPGGWVVKGGYANQLRRPGDARLTEDLDLEIEAAIETAPELLASGFAIDLDDDFSYEVAAPPGALEGPPGGGLRFVLVARLAGTELVRFKVDVSAADLVVGELESCLSDPVVERLGFERGRFPVYPMNQHVAEKLHALTLPRAVENTRARDLVDLAWFIRHFTFRSEALAAACAATFERRATHPWPPVIDVPPESWTRPYKAWRAELDLTEPTPAAAASSLRSFLRPVLAGRPELTWHPGAREWTGTGDRRGGS